MHKSQEGHTVLVGPLIGIMMAIVIGVAMIPTIFDAVNATLIEDNPIKEPPITSESPYSPVEEPPSMFDYGIRGGSIGGCAIAAFCLWRSVKKKKKEGKNGNSGGAK